MRIMMISDHADPLAEIGSKEVGGQNVYVLYLSKFLSRLGASVDVYTRWDNRAKKEVVRINPRLRVIRVKAGPRRYMPRDNFFSVVDEFAENLLARVEKEQLQYDLIHTNYWFSGLIGLAVKKKLHLPLVHVYHSIGQVRYDALKTYKPQDSQYELFQKRFHVEKLIAAEADSVVAESPVEKDLIVKVLGAKPAKVATIPVGVDQSVFKPLMTENARKRLGLAVEGPLLLYVGRIEWRKGIATLITAFKQVLAEHPDARLYVVGGGTTKATRALDAPERHRLLDLANKLGVGDKIHFTGGKPQSLTRVYYSAADAVVVPSYYEPFGIVPLEAMACGTPVVASRTGGLQFSIEDGVTGFLAKPRDPKDLAAKLLRVLKDGKQHFRLPSLNRIKQHFLWQDIAGSYLKHFEKLTETKS